MFYLRLAGGVLGFVAATGYGIGSALLRRDRSRVPARYARLLSRLLLPPFGIRLEVHGEENLYAERPCVYISNHQTSFDVPVLASIYPPDTVVVAKKEIRNIPLFGWLYQATGNVLIDRANRKQAVGRLQEAEEAIRTRGVSVWIFPEGTRATEPGKLLPFKKGAFYMAIATGVPIVPVVASPITPLVDFKRRRSRSGTVEIRVLEPIPTAGLTEDDVLTLIETAHGRMAATLEEMAVRRGFLPPQSRQMED